MELKSYMYPRCGKIVKSISGLTRHVNAYKIPITLPSCLLSSPASILKYNTPNHLDLSSDKFEEDISLGASNNDKEKMRPVDTNSNNDENSRPVDIAKQKPITLNETPWNGLLSE